ncbi:MAG: FtsQ-type POTRA domain-containing protein, partial [Hamadaea sp.]|nr:FtsQ-type POTRA domain-containing protein [Hamadaea sp.]
ARARRRRLQAAAPWAVGGLVVLLAGALTWIALQTSILGVDLIRVTGVSILSPDEVRAAAAVRSGTPLARVDTAEVARRVGGLPPVATVDVGRSWPNTLTITVVERTGVAVAALDGKFAVLDDHGVAFLTLAERPEHLPLLKVAEPGPQDPETVAALRALADLTPELRAQLVQIVADAPARIRLELRKGRVVIWGDATQGELKARVATALLTRSGTQIDVSAPEVVTIS